MTHPYDPDVFRFGIEYEAMVTTSTFEPLGHKQLKFEPMRDLLAELNAPSLDYMVQKYPGSAGRSYYLEGYDLVDEKGEFLDLHVKGIEMSTPIAPSIEGCMEQLRSMYSAVQDVVRAHDMETTIYGSHPIDNSYVGQQGDRSRLTWPAAETAMTHYGIHVNVSFPDSIEATLSREHIRDAFEYFGPALVILSADTPRRSVTRDGTPFNGLSERSFRRSFTRRPLYFRDDQNYRKEVTLFDMTNAVDLVAGYIAVTTGLMLDDKPVPFVPDSFCDANMRAAALQGYDAKLIDRAFSPIDASSMVNEALERAADALTKYDLSTEYLKPLLQLADKRHSPADYTAEAWDRAESLPAFLRSRAELIEQ